MGAGAEHVSDETMQVVSTKRRALRDSHARRQLSGVRYNRDIHERMTPLERALRAKLAAHNSLTDKDKRAGRKLVGKGTSDCFLDGGVDGDTYCEICSEDDHEHLLDGHRRNRRLNKIVPQRRHLGDQTEAIQRKQAVILEADIAAETAA